MGKKGKAARFRGGRGSVFYCNVYDVRRRYGGPEEGDWYYDEGTPLESMRLPGRVPDHATVMMRYSMKRLGQSPRILREITESQKRFDMVAGALRDNVYCYCKGIQIEWETHPARAYPARKPTYS